MHSWSTRTARTHPSADCVCHHVCQENDNVRARAPGPAFRVRVIAQPLSSPYLQRTLTTAVQQGFPRSSLLSCLWDSHLAPKPAQFTYSALTPPTEPLQFDLASYLKIPLCGKSSTTDCATKRFFTGMGALVYLQCTC